ncbi:MAG: sugar ABC transporter permease [Verrucomicrobia bacterium]|nr:sugar ABC transporter permease [Verrucomicrobiota bacterium]
MATPSPAVSAPATAPASPPAAESRRSLLASESFCGWLFIAPALVGFTLFYLLPTLRAFYIGLTNWNLMRAPKFIGMENYSKLLEDQKFWDSMWVTLLYVIYNIPIQTVFGLLLAVLLNRLTGSVLMRSIMLVPYLISNVVAAMIWLWMLDPILGVINIILDHLGMGRHAFFNEAGLALPTVAAVNIWRHTGFIALLFYTGLQAIPGHLYEAARIEGASEWRMFRSITLPLLRPTLVFVLVTSVIGSFQIFDTVAVTTQGGPGNATRTIVWYIYQMAFSSMRMGYASAMSTVLFIGLILVTLIQMRVLRSGHSDMG